MALNEHQLNILKTTWKEVIKVEMKTIGITVLFNLFTDYPESLKAFQHIVPLGTEITMENMENNERLVAHGEAATLGFHKLVGLLENPKELAEYLQDLTTAHKLKNVEPQNFEYFGHTLMKYLKHALGEMATTEVMDTWIGAYGMMQKAILSEY